MLLNMLQFNANVEYYLYDNVSVIFVIHLDTPYLYAKLSSIYITSRSTYLYLKLKRNMRYNLFIQLLEQNARL